MQESHGLVDNNSTEFLSAKLFDEIKYRDDYETEENISFTDSFKSDIIDGNEELKKINILPDKTVDNYQFVKWFCDYNKKLEFYISQLKFYKNRIVTLKSKLIEKDNIIQSFKGGVLMDESIKLLFDNLGKKIDKIDDKITKLDEKVSPKIENINIKVAKIETDLDTLKKDVKTINDDKKFKVEKILIPIIIAVITGIMSGTITLLFKK